MKRKSSEQSNQLKSRIRYLYGLVYFILLLLSGMGEWLYFFAFGALSFILFLIILYFEDKSIERKSEKLKP